MLPCCHPPRTYFSLWTANELASYRVRSADVVDLRRGHRPDSTTKAVFTRLNSPRIFCRVLSCSYEHEVWKLSAFWGGKLFCCVWEGDAFWNRRGCSRELRIKRKSLHWGRDPVDVKSVRGKFLCMLFCKWWRFHCLIRRSILYLWF